MSPAEHAWDVGWDAGSGVSAPRDLGLPAPKNAELPLEEEELRPPRKPFTSNGDGARDSVLEA